jgi:hypothetical protein
VCDRFLALAHRLPAIRDASSASQRGSGIAQATKKPSAIAPALPSSRQQSGEKAKAKDAMSARLETLVYQVQKGKRIFVDKVIFNSFSLQNDADAIHHLLSDTVIVPDTNYFPLVVPLFRIFYHHGDWSKSWAMMQKLCVLFCFVQGSSFDRLGDFFAMAGRGCF